MLFEIFEEIAVDEEFESESDGSVDETPIQEQEQVEEIEQQTVETPTEFDIDGEKFTIEQMREFKQGYLRQSDYTKKTQEIANMKKQYNDAVELYDYLRENPEIARQLAQLEPSKKDTIQPIVDPTVHQLSVQLQSMEIDRQLEMIKSKDSLADEIQIINIATQHRCPIDVAYNIWRGQNMDKILEHKLKQQSKDITEKIKTNNTITKTMITNKDKPSDVSFGLSEQEISYALKLGMTPEEYKRWS